MTIAISLIIMIALLMLGVAVPLAFFGVIIFMIIVGGYDPSFLLPYGYTKMNTLVMFAMPLFIMAGGIIEKGKLGEHLVSFVELFFGRIRGGTAVVAVVSCALFGSITGSANATMTVIGAILWPRMNEQGYSKAFSSSLLASCALLGSYIPPSGIMIIYCWVSNQSVLACFLAVFGVGLVMMTLFSTFAYFWCKSPKREPLLQDPVKPEGKFLRRAGKVTWKAIPALIFPVIVLGGIYGGFMTPTEAAAVSVIYAVPIALFVYKGMNFKELLGVLVDTATTSGVIIFMLYCVMMLSRIYITEDLPGMMTSFLTSISDNKYVILLMINLLLVIIGMLMDDISAMILTVPIFLPILTSLGVSPVHFAAIIATNLGLACVTPPCAPMLFLACRLNDTKLGVMLKPTLMIILFIWFPALMLVTFIPQISLFFPHLIMGMPM